MEIGFSDGARSSNARFWQDVFLLRSLSGLWISFLKSLQGLPSVYGVLISSHEHSRHAGAAPTQHDLILPDLSPCWIVTSQVADTLQQGRATVTWLSGEDTETQKDWYPIQTPS